MELYKLTAYEVAEKLRSREIRATDLIESIFDRIEEVDGKVGSFVSLRKEKALAEAKNVDEKIANGVKLKPFEGIPVAIKDNMVSLGDPATAASRILCNYEGIYDATVVKKLKEQGAIIIGKTNMDEFAMGSTTKTSYVKETKNPWSLDRVPGGSSGGAAASVAAGEAIVSLGSDTGGSIRQPASFCGVVGLKPTYGRVSRYGLMAFGSSLDQIGPITRTVRDAAMTLNVISGMDDMDSTLVDIEVPDYTEYLTGDIKGMKIGVPKEYFIDGMDPEVKKVIEESIEKFKKLGAEIIEISLPHTKYAVATYYVLAPAEASSNLARYDGVRYGHRSENSENIADLYIKSRSEGFGNEVKRRIMIGTYVLSAGFYDAYYKKAQQVRRLIKEDFDNAFSEVDIVLTPTSPSIAFKLDEEKDPVQMYLSDIYTLSANLAGIPGLSIPAGTAHEMPVGIQLLGKSFGEGELLKAGDAFERTSGTVELPEIK